MAKRIQKKKVTLQDIAEATGYSKNTVSLAMKSSRRLPKDTISSIQKKAKQLGYKPNLIARNLTTGKSGLIGVYASTLHDSVRTQIANGLVTELRSSQYSPILGLGQNHSGSWYTSPWVKTLELLNVDAMVIVREFVTKMPEWLLGKPTILVGCQPNDLLECDYVALDRYEAANLGIDYLIDHGHKEILVCADKESYFADGCKKRLSERGAVEFLPPFKAATIEDGLPELLEFVLENKDKFTAIIFGDSPVAVEFLTMLSDAGVSVPKELAVISYDYLPYAKHLRVPLTTISQPIEEIVSEAVTLTNSRLEKPNGNFIHKQLKHKIVPGKSV